MILNGFKIVIITFCVLITIGFINFLNKPKASTKEVIPSVASTPTFLNTNSPKSLPSELDVLPDSPTIKTETIREETAEYKINIEYASIEGLANKDVQNKINALFKPNVNEIRSGLIEMAKDSKKYLYVGGQSYEKRSFVVTYKSPKILSIEVDYSGYNGSAAHDFAHVYTYNFNLENGEQLSLKELFKKDSQYLQILSKKSIAYFLSKAPEEVYGQQIREGATPTDKNFKDFLLSNDSLIIVFQPYQVATGADGSQEIRIPYTDLLDIVDKNGVLKEFLVEKIPDNISFKCPESHTDKAQYIDELGKFVSDYQKANLNATIEDLGKYRVALLQKHNCAETLKNISN